MYLDTYFTAVSAVFEEIRTGQRGAIEAAGDAVAQSVRQQGALLVMDTGHMLKHEAYLRAGGLVAIAQFGYEFRLESELLHRKETRPPDELTALEARQVALALDTSLVQAGDVMLINSNSGRTANVIELALQCRERGIGTIGLASRAQMNATEAAHASGQKLFDVVDIAIDNCTPVGDAAVEVRDNERMCPLSGIASAYVLWAVQAVAVERLQALGLNPSIYRSVHLGGTEHVDEQRARYSREGI